MTAQEYVIHATNRPPLAFQGRVVAQASGPVDDANLKGRYHAITVYEATTGDLHLVFEFKSNWPGETHHCDVELSMHCDEIAEVMLSYDPSEYLDTRELQQRHVPEIASFVKRLHRQYDDLCAIIEHQMIAYQPCVHGGEFGGSDHSNPGWKQWMPFRKPR